MDRWCISLHMHRYQICPSEINSIEIKWRTKSRSPPFQALHHYMWLRASRVNARRWFIFRPSSNWIAHQYGLRKCCYDHNLILIFRNLLIDVIGYRQELQNTVIKLRLALWFIFTLWHCIFYLNFNDSTSLYLSYSENTH